MASPKVNKCNFRKRKLETDFIFEVNDDDCSPPSSPGAPDETQGDNETKTQQDDHNLKSTIEKRAVLTCSDSNKVIILSTESENDLKTPKNDTIPEEQEEKVKIENSEIGASDKFLFSLKFRDKKFADLNREKIISAIMGCLDCEVREEPDDVGLKIKFWESKTASDMDITSESEDETTDTFNLNNLFVVDTTPSSNKNLNGQPKFYSRTKYIIQDEANLKKPKKEDVNKCNQSTCFNCDGPHPLRDCKEPKNYKKINAARNQHKAMKSAKNTRYHLENEQKYGHLGPGRLSANLREALGIEENEIPPHIYHMRRIGYPIGWLEASKRTESNLQLYDINGKNDTNKNLDDLEYDLEKIIEYPGFNAPLPEGSKDLHSRYNCPPYSEKFSVKFMLEHLKKQKSVASTSNVVDENSPEEVEKEPSRPESPTLTDLELQKKQLLDMLNNGITLDSPSTSTEKRVTLEQLEIETPPSIVKSSLMGTPILKNCSPFEKLPNPDNFSVGVSQVINFENLPDSTGKYEQMTNVLDKVRKTIRFSNGGNKIDKKSKDDKDNST